MIQITNPTLCCGCHACASACPKQCITMQEDNEGFLYPIVDADTCIECGLCEKICPVINQGEPRKPLKVYAAKNKDEEIRRQSSSGGVFTLLAEAVINEGGVVFGAKFDKDWNVVHDWTDTVEGIAAFRGSKYVQSTIGNTYKEAREFLRQGRKVLFSGTPCQIAGLKKFLRKEYDNLLTIDVACHGVPSPFVWRTYLEETRKYICIQYIEVSKSPSSTMDLPLITGISFRDKTNGWKRYGIKLCYSHSKSTEKTHLNCVTNKDSYILQPYQENIYMKGFLKDLYLRPSCHACPSKAGKSGSDITIADFWGIQNFYPEFDDDKGVGLVLINSDKGKLAYCKVNVYNQEATYEQGLSRNPCIEHSVERTKYTDLFWKEFVAVGMKSIEDIANQMKPSVFRRYLSRIKNIVKRIINNIR